MNKKEILKNVADTLLDEPVTFQIPVKTEIPIKWWEKAIGRKPDVKEEVREYRIKGATLRTMVRCSRLLLTVENPAIPEEGALDWSYSVVEKEAHTMAEIIATAIHNDKSEVPPELTELIYDTFTSSQIKDISNVVLAKLNLVDFITCITSMRDMRILEETPESTEGEKTASGKQSAE